MWGVVVRRVDVEVGAAGVVDAGGGVGAGGAVRARGDAGPAAELAPARVRGARGGAGVVGGGAGGVGAGGVGDGVAPAVAAALRPCGVPLVRAAAEEVAARWSELDAWLAREVRETGAPVVEPGVRTHIAAGRLRRALQTWLRILDAEGL